MAHTKSGMGTDVDGIRMVLLVAAWGPPLYVGSRLTGVPWWWIALIFMGPLFGILFGVWVARNWYLDKIEGMQVTNIVNIAGHADE